MACCYVFTITSSLSLCKWRHITQHAYTIHMNVDGRITGICKPYHFMGNREKTLIKCSTINMIGWADSSV
jgi:hypothetical protein